MDDKNNHKESSSEMNANNDKHSPFTFALNAELGIADVRALSENLKKLFKDKDELVLDASQVENVDTATLQLLVVFAQNHANLHWKQPSEAFLNSSSILDLDQHLGLNSNEDTRDSH